MNKSKTIAIIASTIILTSSCDLLNCTQASVSGLRIQVSTPTGSQATLSDTLTVKACGTDSVIINRNTNTKEIVLPLSYHAKADTFILHHYGTGYHFVDTLYVNKTNNLYFESPDCPTVIMHTIHSASCTTTFVDSVKLIKDKVNFEETTNLKLFVKEQKTPSIPI